MVSDFPGEFSSTGIECDCGRPFESRMAYLGHKASCDGPPKKCEMKRCARIPKHFAMAVRQTSSPLSGNKGIKTDTKYICTHHKVDVKEKARNSSYDVYFKDLNNYKHREK